MPAAGRAPSLPARLPQHAGQLPLLLPPRLPARQRQGLLRRYLAPSPGPERGVEWDAPSSLPALSSVCSFLSSPWYLHSLNSSLLVPGGSPGAWSSLDGVGVPELHLPSKHPSSPHLSLPHQPDIGLSWCVPSQGGRVLCEAVSCPVSCSHPLPTPAGSCCPSCTGCLHDGVTRAEGDVFSPSDGNCTVCVCLAGNVSCITPECPPGSCPSTSPADCCSCQPAKCSFRGHTYAHGARFSLDGDDCTTCICRGGEVECSFAPCPMLDCPQHQQHLGPGQCCFTCRDTPAPPAGCFVDDNGVEFPIGQIWSPGDPCELCICQVNENLLCFTPPTCPCPGARLLAPLLPSGCRAARGRGPWQLPSSSPASWLGSVACSPVDCAIFCTYPFHPEGECCPVCNDCNYQGRKVVNGQTFTPEGQPCTRCTCQVSGVPVGCPCQWQRGWRRVAHPDFCPSLPAWRGELREEAVSPLLRRARRTARCLLQSDPALAQLEAIPSCRLFLGSRDSSPLSAPSFQGVVEGHEVSPQPPLLQTKPPQFPQLLPIRPVLQTLHQLHCPSLDAGWGGVGGPRGEVGANRKHLSVSHRPPAPAAERRLVLVPIPRGTPYQHPQPLIDSDPPPPPGPAPAPQHIPPRPLSREHRG
uniref:von Willebrand factor C and EGF domains n=1 Tax=Strix occidentalis caurina TaxID=311401 RepID=A0A8D0EHR3_STROC